MNLVSWVQYLRKERLLLLWPDGDSGSIASGLDVVVSSTSRGVGALRLVLFGEGQSINASTYLMITGWIDGEGQG